MYAGLDKISDGLYVETSQAAVISNTEMKEEDRVMIRDMMRDRHWTSPDTVSGLLRATADPIFCLAQMNLRAIESEFVS